MSEKRLDPAWELPEPPDGVQKHDVYTLTGHPYKPASEIVPGDIILTVSGWYPVKAITVAHDLAFELINGEIHTAPATAYIAVAKSGPQKILIPPPGVEVTWHSLTPPQKER